LFGKIGGEHRGASVLYYYGFSGKLPYIRQRFNQNISFFNILIHYKYHPVLFKPSCSSRANMMFIFCTAWPAAPFRRLSMHETIISLFTLLSSTKPIAQLLLPVTCLISGSESVTCTKGS